jgi:gliding motility-associated-like protein
MNKHHLYLLFSFLIAAMCTKVYAQPLNDNCAGAINITDPKNYCSNVAQYRNTGATPSNFVGSGATCFANSSADVWFTFVAQATDVVVNVTGFTTGNAQNTLKNPQIAMYYGACGSNVSELGCEADLQNDGTVELYEGGLIIGERYYFRIQGANNNQGTFTFCLTNYNPPSNPTSDCPTSSVLCDKSSFVVKNVTGAGNDIKELEDATCFSNGAPGNYETNSNWFKWTCDKSGTLTLNLTPLSFADDLDFAIYELPNINDCKGKKLLRCMAAGDSVFPSTCMGPTGLNLTSTDISEDAGCNPIKDNYIKALDMVAGKSYTIVVNNFTSTGNGFRVDFGGTGTFLGPTALIIPSAKKACIGENITFVDASTFALGQIVDWKWNFGVEASVSSGSGKGPYTVYYKKPGVKYVTLTVKSEKGCLVTTILDSIIIKPFSYDTILKPPTCNGGIDGEVDLKPKCGKAPYKFSWNAAPFSTNNKLSNVSRGTYNVIVTDDSGEFFDTLNIALKEFQIEIDKAKSNVTNPKCFGSKDGLIQLFPLNGIPSYLYNFGQGFGFNNFRSQLAPGTYNVTVEDGNKCRGLFIFDLIDPPLLEVEIDTINVTCFGKNDGKAIAYPSGGVGNYKFNWNTGAGSSTLSNLKPGCYNLTLNDANQCETSSRVCIREPSQILINSLDALPTICYGDSTGSIKVTGAGGTPPFKYSIDGLRFQSSTDFNNLAGKEYNVTIKDSTGCRISKKITVLQPQILGVYAEADKELYLGKFAYLTASTYPTNRKVKLIWTPLDSISCDSCPSIKVNPVKTTLYRVSIIDADSCTAFDEVLVKIIEDRPVYIPNVFSPNGDGRNDFFAIYGGDAVRIIKEMRVFNRWGNQLYEGFNLSLNNNGNPMWDGTFRGQELDPDVYTFYALIEFVDGKEIIYKGDITLLK